MKKIIVTVCLCALLAGTAHAEWATYVIRNANSGGASPAIQTNESYPGATEFVVTEGGQKAAWGTDLPEGTTIGNLQWIKIERLDTNNYPAGSGPAVAPYFNIWVTDGEGNYAIIANEPSNGAWQPGNQQWDMTWNILADKEAKIHENSAAAAIGGWIEKLDVDDDGLTFEDIAGLKIEAPTIDGQTILRTDFTTGAPVDLATNETYDFNWVFGDTLSNYVSGEDGFVVSNPVVSASSNAAVPEPASCTLILLGVLSLIGLRCRRK